MKVVLALALMVAFCWRMAHPVAEERPFEESGQALLQAASMGNEQEVRRILAGGTPIDYRDSAQYTALTYACCSSKLSLVHFMLESGADPNAISQLKHTPLMAAMTYGDPALLRELLDHGANVNAQALSGVTPLMVASDRANAPAIALLLEKGADPSQRDASGQNALDHLPPASTDPVAVKTCLTLLSRNRIARGQALHAPIHAAL